MISVNRLDDILNRISHALDIGDDLFKEAEEEYSYLGDWINKKIDEEYIPYAVDIYPQGSMALGTVVRPLLAKGESDTFDLDWVLAFRDDYGLSPREMKCEIVQSWLQDYLNRFGYRNGQIEEKRRCWHVENNDHPGFHTDVVPGYVKAEMLQITDKNEVNSIYSYIPSNPKGYQEWFFKRCEIRKHALHEAYEREFRADAKIERLKRNKLKTPLQKAIQILKRYRDVQFQSVDEEEHIKPISIIITTLAATFYENEDSIFATIESFLQKAESYIESNKTVNGYFIADPSNKSENLADKWNMYPERAKAFLDFLYSARNDFDIEKLTRMDSIELSRHLKKILGEKMITEVYNEIAEERKLAQTQGKLKVDPRKGTLSAAGSIIVPASHHYGR